MREAGGPAHQLGFEMYSSTSVRICRSISLGWSPTGIYAWVRNANQRNGREPRTHLREAREVDEREVQHIRAVYAQVYRQFRHALVLPGYAERLLLDLPPDLAEIHEPLVDVQELAPLVAARCVDQLEHQRPTRHDALSAREKVSPDNAGK